MLIGSIYAVREDFHLRREKKVGGKDEYAGISVSRSKAGFRKLGARGTPIDFIHRWTR